MSFQRVEVCVLHMSVRSNVRKCVALVLVIKTLTRQYIVAKLMIKSEYKINLKDMHISTENVSVSFMCIFIFIFSTFVPHIYYVDLESGVGEN